MPVAIIKISCQPQYGYLHPVVGGFAGTCFCVDDGFFVSAYHFLGSLFQPNDGYNKFRVYLVSQIGGYIEITEDSVAHFPEIDMTVIDIKREFTGTTRFQLSTSGLNHGNKVCLLGYPISMGFEASFKENGDIMQINVNPSPTASCGEIVSVKQKTVSSNDVNIADIECVELSCGAEIGQSGGPIILAGSNTVIGFGSHGPEADIAVKSKVYGISSREIIPKLALLSS